MMKLLVFREYLKRMYGNYSTYFDPGFKFLLALITMIVFNANVGFMPVLKNPAIVVIIALVCAFLPTGITVLVMFVFLVANIYSVSLEMAAVILGLLVIMYILYFRFAPADGYVLLMMPVLFMLKIPYVMPLIIGLIATPISVVSVAFGTIIYFIIAYIGKNAAVISNVSSASGVKKLTTMLDEMINNKEMYMYIAALCIMVIVVFIIRRMSIDHAWTIAVITGGIVGGCVLLIALVVFDISGITTTWLVAVMDAVSIALSIVIQLLILSVDYSRTELVQFEDDDYYYYVKAVPKIKVATQEVTVKRINARKPIKK